LNVRFWHKADITIGYAGAAGTDHLRSARRQLAQKVVTPTGLRKVSVPYDHELMSFAALSADIVVPIAIASEASTIVPAPNALAQNAPTKRAGQTR
jgi:hypothetical protein